MTHNIKPLTSDQFWREYYEMQAKAKAINKLYKNAQIVVSVIQKAKRP